MKKPPKKSTPVRGGLVVKSKLLGAVKDGLGAVKGAHKGYFDEGIRQAFGDSLELDEAVREGNEQDNRWDYLLGHSGTNNIIAVEPHSAKQDQISTVIKKRTSAKEHLRDELRPGVTITKWLWVASNGTQFANTDKAILRLNQNGIQFVGSAVKAKHLA